MSGVDVDLSSDEGMGGSTVNLGLYDPPHEHSTAITRLDRADSLGDSVGMF